MIKLGLNVLTFESFHIIKNCNIDSDIINIILLLFIICKEKKGIENRIVLGKAGWRKVKASFQGTNKILRI